MLDSMIRHPRPTRAEVTDVANAIYDGTDCVMLSGETAAGKYPVESLETMAKICSETEQFLPERSGFTDRGGVRNVNSSIGHACVEIADQVNARCIVCPTHSGRTARLISTFRPHLPIYATTPSEASARRCCFLWVSMPLSIWSRARCPLPSTMRCVCVRKKVLSTATISSL